MPFCPKCRYEYVDGIKKCPDCDVDLVPELEQEKADLEVDPDIHLVNIARVNYPIEADLIRMRLEEEGIPCFMANETVTQLAGGRIGLFPIVVQVREENAEQALQIIEEMREK